MGVWAAGLIWGLGQVSSSPLPGPHVARAWSPPSSLLRRDCVLHEKRGSWGPAV